MAQGEEGSGGWRAWLLARGRSSLTAEVYRRDIAAVQHALGKRSLARATYQELEVALRPFRKATSFNRRRAALVSYYAFLVSSGARKDNPAKALTPKHRRTHLPRPLEAEDLALYLSVARNLGGPYYVLALLGSDAALRVSEARRVHWRDVGRDALHIPRGKGGHEGYVPLTERLRLALSLWQRECPSEEWVLPGRTPDLPASPSHAQRLHRRIIEEAALKPYTFHQLRHTAATEVLRASGGQLLVAKDFLRHRSLSSTLVYLRVENASVREAVAKLYQGGAR